MLRGRSGEESQRCGGEDKLTHRNRQPLCLRLSEWMGVHVSACVCVCEKKREREREKAEEGLSCGVTD